MELLQLPPEVLMQILSYLSTHDLQCNVAIACKQLNALSKASVPNGGIKLSALKETEVQDALDDLSNATYNPTRCQVTTARIKLTSEADLNLLHLILQKCQNIRYLDLGL